MRENQFFIIGISVKIRWSNKLLKEVLAMTTLNIDQSKLTIMGFNSIFKKSSRCLVCAKYEYD